MEGFLNFSFRLVKRRFFWCFPSLLSMITGLLIMEGKSVMPSIAQAIFDANMAILAYEEYLFANGR